MKTTYAIGDIHGCVDQLRIALDWIEQQAGDDPETEVVTLGDYVDRGPDSRGVIQLLIEREKIRPGRYVFLAGNHDVAMRNSIISDWDGDVSVRMNEYASWYGWLGGAATVKSYIRADQTPDVVSFSQAVPFEHKKFLHRMKKMHATDSHVFVHGGILPDVLPEDTHEDKLTWLRDMDVPDLKGRMVVVGHTPKGDVYVGKHHVNIDTSCVYGGPLTVAVIKEGTRLPTHYFKVIQQER